MSMMVSPYRFALAGENKLTGVSGSAVFGANTTFRIVIKPNYFTVPITNIRVTFFCGAGSSNPITAAYVGQQASSGDAFDFASTPTQILFGGSSGFTMSAGSTKVADTATVTLDVTKGIIVSLDMSGGSDGGNTTDSNFEFYQLGSAPQASIVNAASGTRNGDLKFLYRLETNV